ncbi:TPA: hypothetical protein N0F65_000933 [Lagenidium giganteum]|uniref:CAP-Gly domain-containing protein n=1 Tax=Lagenidium giganteum TaxID=4803 RepID=A0AAV2YLF8_9STRA|nr:TPA: hypothetical protein N0F65_000933 [Lagenidium giganteum]
MDISIGSRVITNSNKTGIVRFIGETDFAQGEWVGIELDKPEGKNNGELAGRVYFTCAPNYGLFIKSAFVKPLGAAAPPTPVSTGSATRSGSVTAASPSSATSRLPLTKRMSIPGPSSSVRSTALAATGASPAATRTPSAAASARGTPSSTASTTGTNSLRRPSGSTTSSSSRLSLDPSRRPSLGRTTTPSVSSDELDEAKAKIQKLEDDLEQRNRQVEQLKQNLAVLREAQERIAAEGAERAAPAPAEPTVVTTGITEEELREKVELVRREAEAHVERIRIDLEEQLAQTHAEHDEIVDELRLENATQRSEIKALETELAQHKARIAQFTQSEQKRAEEVVMAMAKTSSGARKVETLEAQVTELQDMIEVMTLEKETLEMDKEIAEEHVEECQAEIEKLKASLALATSNQQAEGAGAAAMSGDVAEENMKLRAAVKALHERGAEEKNELNKKIRLLQRENAELVMLRQEVEELSSKRTVLESEVEELKEMLDVASAYESMVEELTETNLTLGEKVSDLEATVISLESLKEMSEEMEHQHNEYEAELREEIESQRVNLAELKRVVLELQASADDKERTVTRFRDVTRGLQDQVRELQEQLRREVEAQEDLKGTAQGALVQTMNLRQLASSARENEAEAARQRINADQARLENAFLRAAIPSSLFSDMDQKILRVRLRLGRVSGKADMLLQYIRKDLEFLIQNYRKEPSERLAVDATRAVHELVLGEKLTALVCQAKEDLFILECHLTTEEEFAEACARLDGSKVGLLESALDASISAFGEGSLIMSTAGDPASYNRLVDAIDEWHAGRAAVDSKNQTESFPLRCAVVKLRSRRSVTSLLYFLAMLLSVTDSTRRELMPAAQPDTPATDVPQDGGVQSKFELVAAEIMSLLDLAYKFNRRADIDLAWSDEDLDGLVAVGGDAVELIHAYAAECQGIWSLAKDKLATPPDVASFVEQTLPVMLTSLKDRVTSLFNLVCHGAFTDAVVPRARDRYDASNPNAGGNGRAQWQIRAQAIHNDLANASTLRSSLKDLNDVCQNLQLRIRELERGDSQHRVVTQKLESEVLRLTEEVNHATNDKQLLEKQLAKEREQFDFALDESIKEKAALDTANRELRKQLKRSSDAGSSLSASTKGRRESALGHGDTEALRGALEHARSELEHARNALAKERIERVLGPCPRVAKAARHPEPLAQSLQDLAKFARETRARCAMPRMADLTSTTERPEAQLVQRQLTLQKTRESLAALRTRISTSVKDAGWNADVAQAIARGENVFGWQPPELERPPVLLGRVSLQNSPLSSSPESVSNGKLVPVRLVLQPHELDQLRVALVC